MVSSNFSNILVVDDDRECRIPLTYHQRCSKIRNGSHEDHEGCSQNRRHTKRNDYQEEAFYSTDTHVGRCFKQRFVDVLHSTGDVHEHQWEKLEGQNQKYSIETIDVWNGDSKCGLDEFRYDSSPSKKIDPCIRTNERSGHRRQDYEHLKELSALHFIHVVEISQRNPKDKRNGTCTQSHLEAIGESSEIVRLTEELYEMLERQLTCTLVYYGLPNYLQQRVDHEKQVESKHDKACDHPEIEFCFLLHLSLT